MRKYGSVFFFSFVLIAMFCLAGYGFADQEAPDGELAAPPPLEVTGPPDVVVVPSESGQDVYMIPGEEGVGVYVHQGVWYRQYRGGWFSSPVYNGIWSSIGITFVPQVIVSVPPRYAYYLPLDYHRIHWYDYHNHWRYWARERYWHRQSWYRREMRADIRRDRMRHIEQHQRDQRAVDKKRSGRGADARGGKDAIKGGKDVAQPGVKKIQNVKGDQGHGKKPGVKQDQSIARGGQKSSQGQSMAGNQQMKKGNQPQVKQQVQKQQQPGQQIQRQPQRRQQMQKQPQTRQQAPKQQAQKRPQAQKQDNKNKKH
jgi:hypothetical protein